MDSAEQEAQQANMATAKCARDAAVAKNEAAKLKALVGKMTIQEPWIFGACCLWWLEKLFFFFFLIRFFSQMRYLLKKKVVTAS